MAQLLFLQQLRGEYEMFDRWIRLTLGRSSHLAYNEKSLQTIMREVDLRKLMGGSGPDKARFSLTEKYPAMAVQPGACGVA